jgi:hypothetical protein
MEGLTSYGYDSNVPQGRLLLRCRQVGRVAVESPSKCCLCPFRAPYHISLVHPSRCARSSLIVRLFCAASWLGHDVHHPVTEDAIHRFLQNFLYLAYRLGEVFVWHHCVGLQPAIQLVEVVDMFGMLPLVWCSGREC